MHFLLNAFVIVAISSAKIGKLQNTAKLKSMEVCQNAHLLLFTHKAPTFTSWGFVIT